jgi:hypothetical protein
MRRHALTDAAFAALAAGRPSAATVHELRRAQLSKHLLLLRAIVKAAPGQTKLWYAQLEAADRANPSAARAVLADPLFGAWAASCLAALTGGRSPEEAGIAHLARVAAAASRSAACGTARRLSAICDGITIDVRLEDVDPLRARLGLAPTGRLTSAEVAHWQRCLADAWRLLVARHRPDAEILAAVLRVVVPVQPDPAAGGISATSAEAFGAVAMSAPRDGTALAVGLLHESQHNVLNATRYLFDLHRDPDAVGYSQWRDDPRPASGILHGAYAYLAVTRFWRTEGGRAAAFEFARWRSAVAAAADDLLGGGLAPAGTRFVSALRDEVRPWLDEPVESDIARLAAGANDDHRLRWRLRNLTVDPAAAQALADAWQRGLPPPQSALVSRLVPAPRRALESSDRLKLTHRLLRDGPSCLDRPESPPAADPGIGGGTAGTVGGGQPGGAAAAGDVAYLRGDVGTALCAYRNEVVERPHDDAAWAGLALVAELRALRERPEVVAAVYRALGERDQDPIALASWIST